MNRTIVSLLFSFILVLFLSCNKGKIAEYEKTIETLNSQIALLQEEIINLTKEIETYKLTDEYYYQAGADEFLNGHYPRAIDFMNRLKIKFPTSTLIGYADKIIKESENKPRLVPGGGKNTVIFTGSATKLNREGNKEE